MKRLLALAAAVLVGLRAFAGVGIVGGVTAPGAGSDFRAADLFHAGLAFNIPLSKGFALQPEILYSVKGSGTGEIKANIKSGFLEVPFQIQWGFGLAKQNIRIYLFGEPFVGLNLSSGPIGPGTTIGEIRDRIEYGAGLGAGIQLFRHIQFTVTRVWDLERRQFKSSTTSGPRLSVALLF